MSEKSEVQIPESIDPTTDERKNQIVATAAQFSGPLPPPGLMKQYNEVHPEFAERIVASWEKETAHRHRLDEMTISSEIANEQAVSDAVKRGQVLAFVLAFSFLIAGTLLTFFNKQVSGVIFGATGFIGIVLAFLQKPQTVQEVNQDDGDTNKE